MNMRPTLSLIAAAAMTAGFAVAQNQPTPPAPQSQQPAAAKLDPAQLKKEISRFLGIQSGLGLKSIPTVTMDDIDMDAFMNGVRESMTNQDLNPQEIMDKMQPVLMQFQTVIEQRVKELGAANLAASKKFMEANGKKPGIVTTKSGLQYQILTEGKGKVYNEKDYKEPLFKVNYKGTLENGKVFDQSQEPVEFPLQVIPGFEEALKIMPVGSKWKVFVPSELGYGENVRPGSPFGPNQLLIFEIELLDIRETPKTSNAPMQLSPEQIQELMKQQQEQQPQSAPEAPKPEGQEAAKPAQEAPAPELKK